MKHIRKILAAILIVIANISFAQYNEISDQDLVLRSWKTYGLSDAASDNNVLKMWLSIFDKKNYATYAKNEFTLKDKLDQTKQNLTSRLNNMENIAIYYHTESRSFGEYDFAKEQYKFKPFNNFSTEKRLSYTWSDYEKYFRTNLKFFGLDFVDGIPMEKTQAEQFLNRKQQNNIWGQSYNNRTVYLKIYYYTSVEDKVEKSYEFKAYDENKLKCTPLLVQTFGDKNFNEFVCEWWNPNITSYYKQQLINNNVPRGFYESLNQPGEQNKISEEVVDYKIDSDGDGIPDYKDTCPHSKGPASNYGCPEYKKYAIKEQINFVARNIQFEPNSAVIKPVSYKILDEVAAVLNEYQYYDVNIDGHCDHVEGASNSFGSPLYLSQARAKASYDYFIGKGISTSRMMITGYGYDKPIADDYTSAGRAQNRRVEFNLIFK